jgi:hypothetical protein
MRLTLPTLALLGSSLLAGCDGNEGRTDPPNASIQVIHAAPSIGPVTFKRVQVNATPLDFTQGATFSWDVDTYTLNFEILDVDGTVAQTVSTQVTLVEDMAYFLVLREVGGQPDPVLIERPAEIQGMGSEIEILHAATTLNAVDVYIDVDNFDLTTAASRGTIDFDGLLSVPALADGTYEIVLTDAGNQANVRLDSEPISVAGTQGLFLLIIDGAGVGLSPLALAVGDANGTTIADRNSQSGIRVINSLADRETINVGIDGQLMPPLITDLAFATASAFELIASGDHDLNVEATLTPGTLEIDEPIEADVARFATWLITGSTGSMTATLFEDDFRVIPGESKLRVFIGATQNGVGVTDIFVVEPGTDITTVPPTLSSLSETPTPTVRIAPDNYEITVTEQATGAVLAGPIAATIAADGYYGILLTDAAAGTGTEVVLLFDF